MRILAPFIMLALVALVVKHPIVGLTLTVIITAWPLIKWAGRLWLEGFLIAKGVKASHLLDAQPPRPSFRDQWRDRGAFSRMNGKTNEQRTICR